MLRDRLKLKLLRRFRRDSIPRPSESVKSRMFRKVLREGGESPGGCPGFVLPHGRFMRSHLCDNLYHDYHYDQVIPSIRRRATACVTDHATGPGMYDT